MSLKKGKKGSKSLSFKVRVELRVLKRGGGIYKVALLTILKKMLGPSAYAKPIKEYYILTSAQIRSPENEPAVILLM